MNAKNQKNGPGETVPETAGEASAQFYCQTQKTSLQGKACATRWANRQNGPIPGDADDRAALCLGCPAGTMRAALLGVVAAARPRPDHRPMVKPLLTEDERRPARAPQKPAPASPPQAKAPAPAEAPAPSAALPRADSSPAEVVITVDAIPPAEQLRLVREALAEIVPEETDPVALAHKARQTALDAALTLSCLAVKVGLPEDETDPDAIVDATEALAEKAAEALQTVASLRAELAEARAKPVADPLQDLLDEVLPRVSEFYTVVERDDPSPRARLVGLFGALLRGCHLTTQIRQAAREVGQAGAAAAAKREKLALVSTWAGEVEPEAVRMMAAALERGIAADRQAEAMARQRLTDIVLGQEASAEPAGPPSMSGQPSRSPNGQRPDGMPC